MTTDVNEALEAKRLQFTGIEKRVMNHGKADKLTLGVLERLKDSKAECRVTSDVTKLKVKRRRPAVACTRRVACRVASSAAAPACSPLRELGRGGSRSRVTCAHPALIFTLLLGYWVAPRVAPGDVRRASCYTVCHHHRGGCSSTTSSP